MRRHAARTITIVATIVVAADWLTKAAASSALADRSYRLGSLLTLRLSHNPGIAFGLGTSLPSGAVTILTAAVTVAIAVAAVRGTLPGRLPAGLILGGAIGNLGDRVVDGTVVDYLDLGWWPSFNLADAALTVGCITLALTASHRTTSPPEPTITTDPNDREITLSSIYDDD